MESYKTLLARLEPRALAPLGHLGNRAQTLVLIGPDEPAFWDRLAQSAEYRDGSAHKAHVASPEGRDCLTRGCRARRACPVGHGLRLPDQARFHIEAFA